MKLKRTDPTLSCARTAALALSLMLLCAAHAQGQLVRDGLAEPDPQVAAWLPRYLHAHSERFVDWFADGSLLIEARVADAVQLQHVRAPRAPPEQVSFAPEGVSAAAARPYTSDAFVYVSSARGGTAAALRLQQLGATAPTALGDSEARAPLWAHDGKRVALTSLSASGSGNEVDVLDTATPAAARRMIIGGTGDRWHVYGWSSNDQRLLLGRERAGALSAPPESELYLAELDSGELIPVAAPHAFAALERARAGTMDLAQQPSALLAQAVSARFASDGHGIVLLTHQLPPQLRGAAAEQAREFLHLCYTDPTDGLWRELSSAAAHDVEAFAQSADGRYLAYTLNDEGASRLLLFDQRSGQQLSAAPLPQGVIGDLQFDPRAEHLAFTLESPLSPAQVYVLRLSDMTLTRWSGADEALLASAAPPKPVHFPTWDEIDGQTRQLSALFYAPGALLTSPPAPRPVVIWLCSGGGAQCRPGYAPLVQYLVQRLGVVVLAPNVRGSSGFGASFLAAGSLEPRNDAVRDIGALLVWIGLQPGLDRSRVALLGEGYGSYLALSALAQFGDRLSGAVAAFPPSLTALPNVLSIRRPVLIVQGLDNPQVPAYQAAQLREGLRANGVAVQYLAAPDESDGFTQRSNSDAYGEAAASFLTQLMR